MNGKIIKGVAGFYDVDTFDGHIYRCRAKGVFRREKIKPLTGDDVEIDITHEGDAEGNITRIFPRKSELVRPPVANIDQVLLTFAVKSPAPSHYLINRFLVTLRQKALPCILCINKCDLATADEVDCLADSYTHAVSGVVRISAENGTGFDALKAHLRGKVSVVAGPSGVGKSSIINALLSQKRMETGTLSRKIDRGKNTTRHTELFALPEKGTYLCDTPGFMSLDMQEIAPKELCRFYPEFAEREADCHFRGCLHLTEPGCAVRSAVDAGEIARIRYDAYKLLYEELSGRRPVYEKTANKGRK